MEPVKIEKAVGPGPNMSIWSTAPLLATLNGQYYGRVFAEVWNGDVHLVSDPHLELSTRSLAALQSRDTSLRAVNMPWTDQPATGEVPGQTFLGRVVVEVWDDQAVLAITGSESQVTKEVIKMLKSLRF